MHAGTVATYADPANVDLDSCALRDSSSRPWMPRRRRRPIADAACKFEASKLALDTTVGLQLEHIEPGDVCAGGAQPDDPGGPRLAIEAVARQQLMLLLFC